MLYERSQTKFLLCKIPENANYSIATESRLVVLPRDGDKDSAETFRREELPKGMEKCFWAMGMFLAWLWWWFYRCIQIHRYIETCVECIVFPLYLSKVVLKKQTNKNQIWLVWSAPSTVSFKIKLQVQLTLEQHRWTVQVDPVINKFFTWIYSQPFISLGLISADSSFFDPWLEIHRCRRLTICTVLCHFI